MLSDDFISKRSSTSTANTSWEPSTLFVHLVLITVQTIFGIGSVVGGLGLPAFNPLVFALIRELCAGAILLVASIAMTGMWPTAGMEHWRRFLVLVRTTKALCFEHAMADIYPQ